MSLFNWDPALATGDHVVDAHHQELIRLVNRFHETAHGASSRAVVGDTLQKLADYAVSHFQHEERLMVAAGYPDYLAHRAEHQALLAKATELLTGYRSGKLTLPVTLSQFLMDWIQNHIERRDRKMIEFIRRQKKAA